jgi:hypothetical protein
MRKCTATTTAGKPCQAQALPGRDRCVAHEDSPEFVERRDEGRRAGARARGRQLAHGRSASIDRENPPSWWGLATIDEAAAGLAHVARSVLLGDLDPREANAATGALGALVRAREGDMERRLETLERALLAGNR